MKQLKIWTDQWSSILTLMVLIGGMAVSVSSYIIIPEKLIDLNSRVCQLEKDNKEYYKDISVIKQMLTDIRANLNRYMKLTDETDFGHLNNTNRIMGKL